MKKILILCVAALLLTACSAAPEPGTVQNIGNEAPLSADYGTPPELSVHGTDCLTVTATLGTYSWTRDNGDGTQTSVCADSSHPLQWQEFLIPLETGGDTVELYFETQPQSFTVRCWSDACWNSLDAREESVSVSGNTVHLLPGGNIYEVTAAWPSGTVRYGFYAVHTAHIHEPAGTPQTVADPVTGYCGNTQTTVYLDGEEYSFFGSDSVELTDILINLDYDPMKVCRCAPEFTVDTEFGVDYGINLSQSYARCSGGQAELTAKQVQAIQRIIDDLKKGES